MYPAVRRADRPDDLRAAQEGGTPTAREGLTGPVNHSHGLTILEVVELQRRRGDVVLKDHLEPGEILRVGERLDRSDVIATDIADDDAPVVSFTPKSSGQLRVKVTMAACGENPCFFGFAIFEK